MILTKHGTRILFTIAALALAVLVWFARGCA